MSAWLPSASGCGQPNCSLNRSSGGVGALIGCAATVVTFLCTRPVHRWLGASAICLAFAVPWLADQGFHVFLPAVLVGVIRLATPTRPATALVEGAT